MPSTLFITNDLLLWALLGGVAILVVVGIKIYFQSAYHAASKSEREHEMDDKMAEFSRLQAEIAGRMQMMTDIFGNNQLNLTRHVTERLDSMRHSITHNLTESGEKNIETLTRLHERMAILDAAQSNLKDLTHEVVNLRDILYNKQRRGAYGQGRMEAIIRDALPSSAYSLQATLSNKTRPDCILHLPNDKRGLVIDSKFPLESFVFLNEAKTDEARQQAEKRVRNDFQVHIRAIEDKYLIPGETQDVAFLFVPSEALYADLHTYFEDMVQKAHRAHVLIVSPSLLMMAIQLVQSLVRDAAIREQAEQIRTEVTKLLEDMRRMAERTHKLQQHFQAVQEDVVGLATSSDKVMRRAKRIEALDFSAMQGKAE